MIVDLTIGFPIVLEEVPLPKWFFALLADEALWMPLSVERGDVAVLYGVAAAAFALGGESVQETPRE